MKAVTVWTVMLVACSAMYCRQATAKSDFEPDIDFTGKWKNQRGSVMELKQAKDGSISGEYATGVGGAIKGKVVGQIHGDQIVFYVDWFPYSMTAWVGQVLTTKDKRQLLETTWLNTKNVELADEPDSGWSAIRNGGDTFERIP